MRCKAFAFPSRKSGSKQSHPIDAYAIYTTRKEMSPKIFGVGSGKTAASVSRQIYIPDISRHDQADNSCCRLERLIREVDGAARKECRVAQNVGGRKLAASYFPKPVLRGLKEKLSPTCSEFPVYLFDRLFGWLFSSIRHRNVAIRDKMAAFCLLRACRVFTDRIRNQASSVERVHPLSSTLSLRPGLRSCRTGKCSRSINCRPAGTPSFERDIVGQHTCRWFWKRRALPSHR